ncbi:DsbC family protein [Marinobacter caseinilyticus]|uniref:DsbC family protein n=1 Tax=Marinobacter caseinilyticus TaxID=2692195 RepID=UPI00140C793D|nr:DsbC family protein [Marinobacter caseinilyticus]
MTDQIRRLQRIVCLALAVGLGAWATSAAADVATELSERLSKNIPGLQVTNVRESKAPGLYEIETSTGETIYATPDGEFLLTGDLLQITPSGIANVTEAGRADRRVNIMNSFGKEGAIHYPAKGEQKAEIAIFTDIDCPYCRKLHDEMSRLNELGIAVNYFAFPRSGPGTPSFKKYEAVWCSDDQQAAMDAAKGGRQVAAKSCENPVGKQFELGGRVGVTGTPAIILEDGKMVRGYVPADKFAEGLGLL